MAHRFMCVNLGLLVVGQNLSCAIGTYHTATPIEAGKNEFGIFSGPLYITPQRSEFGPYSALLDLSYRRGITSWSDLGIQLGTGTLRVDYNMALINTESFALSIDPQLDTFLLVPRRSRVGIFADVYKSESAILSLNVAPGFHFRQLSPLVAGGLLVKLPGESLSIIIALDGEIVFESSRPQDRPSESTLSLVGGLAFPF